MLLVEDNEDDVFLMQRLLRKANITVPVQVVTDGKQAVDYLAGADPYQDRSRYPMPDLMFLDLKLPFLHGFEVLRWIREQPHLKQLRVIVLSSSLEDKDREKAQALGAPYIVKPPSPEILVRAVAGLPLA